MKRILFSIWCLGVCLSPLRAEEDGSISDVANVDLPPVMVESAIPEYPLGLRRDGIDGLVRVEFIVGKNGQVIAARPVASTDREFSTAAIAAVLRWRFKPGQVKGRPVNTRCEQEIIFNLDQDEIRPMAIGAVRSTPAKPLPPEYDWDQPPAYANPGSAVVYPYAALVAGQAGRVVIQFIIGPDGRGHDAHVREATAPEFAAAAIAGIDGAQFAPATRQGKRIHAVAFATFDFKPDGKGDVPVDAGTKEMLKLLRKHPERIVAASSTTKVVPVRRNAPIYPTVANPGPGAQTAEVEVLIDESGHARLPRVISATAPEFGAAAVAAAAFWIFEPVRQNGRRIVTRVRIPFDFNAAEPNPLAGGKHAAP